MGVRPGSALIGCALALTAIGLTWASTLSALPDPDASFDAFLRAREDTGWGGRYERLELQGPRGRVILHLLSFNPKELQLQPQVAIAPGGIGTRARVLDVTRGTGALVGINANYFDPGTDLPIGFLLQDLRPLSTPYGRRATLGIELGGTLRVLNPEIALLLRTSEGGVPLDGVNRPALPDALIAFTPEYRGPLGDWEDARVLALRDDRVVWVGTGTQALARARSFQEETLLVARGTAQARVSGLIPGDFARVDFTLIPDVLLLRDALQAGPRLLRKGEVALEPWEDFSPELIETPAARSAIALREDGTLGLLVVTRGNGSVGMSLPELAVFLRDRGAVEAMAFDGGSSSALVFWDGVRARWRSLGSTTEVPVALVFRPLPR